MVFNRLRDLNYKQSDETTMGISSVTKYAQTCQKLQGTLDIQNNIWYYNHHTFWNCFYIQYVYNETKTLKPPVVWEFANGFKMRLLTEAATKCLDRWSMGLFICDGKPLPTKSTLFLEDI